MAALNAKLIQGFKIKKHPSFGRMFLTMYEGYYLILS
ncbi:hypothetical protein BCL90_0093 [Pedobacter alluvionis]|uniref:Uncharacterized protein n=1 Tax=Pedobacter alluvionis TaxID=475253 RepID=A0A497Y9A0_9SPHI|nr:hypothetical protein BCL90_0093 [Pedobacter alluvionis]